MAIKLPKQLYVVSLDDRGFLHEYSESTSGVKKRKTQNEWAYGDGVVYLDGNIWYRKWTQTTWEYPGKGLPGSAKRVDTLRDEPIPMKNQPQIWDNVPLDGFKIEDTVSRYSTSNKLWLVRDPRGMLFEVSTDSMNNIIQSATIVKGVITDKCVWKANKDLILHIS